ncbi:P-loop containing nucleoside triphosphate hydrolase protein [Blastocladiella britannica]|nr:P-loop containing nucleoside triphosphate hydrolase protein [Blastocladiella britannica]
MADQRESPEYRASFVSKLLFLWVMEILMLARTKVLEFSDLWALPRFLWSGRNADSLGAQWEKEMVKYRATGKRPSLLMALAKTFGLRVVLIIVLAHVSTGLGFMSPFFVRYFVGFVGNIGTADEQSRSEGISVALVFLVVSVTTTIVLGQQYQHVFMFNVAVRTAVQNFVYRKAMRIPSRMSLDSGKIMNHMQVDATSVGMPILPLCEMVVAPISLVVALVLLYNQVGWVLWMAPGTMLLTLPFLGRFAGMMMKYRVKALAQTDGRIKAITQAIAGIKTIKLYGWLPFIRNRVLGFREKELYYLKKVAGVMSMQIGVSFMLPTISTFAVFTLYTLIEGANSLTPTRVFVTLSIMRMLENPVQALVWGWNPIVEALASIRRLTDFLITDDLEAYVERLPLPSAAAGDAPASTKIATIEIKDGKFAFTAESKFELSIPHLAIPRGSLLAVVGPVGAGKSALLAAILGEINKSSGTVTVRGQVAFVTQQAWILNTSLRENITFGLPYDEKRYNRVIDACALRRDLESLAQGNETVIGEKGISLSGGQKARVSLARACYASEMGEADVLLLDDVFSAVDAHVDRHLFDALFNGANGILRSKTVVLVTHAVHHLAEMDSVLLIRDGAVAESGTYDELMATKDGFVRNMVDEYMAKRHNEGARDDDESSSADSVASSASAADASDDTAITDMDGKPKIRRNLSRQQSGMSQGGVAAAEDTDDSKKKAAPVEDLEEKKSSGSVSWRVYWTYFTDCGLANMGFSMFATILSTVASIGIGLWLGAWSTAAKEGNADLAYYLGIYGGLVIGNGMLNMLSMYFFMAVVAIRGARATMDKLLKNTLALPMSFFDTTPSGRLLNRFSNDQKSVDGQIPAVLSQLQFMAFSVVGIFITAIVAAPYFIVALIPLLAIFLAIQSFYLTASREVQRINMVTTSPVFNHFSETLDGLATVRAYHHNARFMATAERRLDASSTGSYNTISVNRWLFVALNLVGNLIVASICFIGVLSTPSGTGVFGVALTWLFDITFLLSALIRSYGQLENAVVSVERIDEYARLPTEAAQETAVPLDAEWPANGEISFSDYETRYREGLPAVLHGIDAKIPAGAKVGVVGRTGSGKSTLTLALFRILEATRGTIAVDGVDVSTLGLHDLRTRLTILPQDPILFEASVRENLDPTLTHDDTAMWSALEGAHLAEYIRGLDGGLDADLAPSSLSVGQAQLLTLARAILRKTRVLVLDEATASIDHQTDDIVQKTIRREFEGCTVITIAHRLATILDYDYILVLDHGNVVEFDTPAALLANTSSEFYSLAKESKLVQ